MAKKLTHPERPMYIERVEVTYRVDPSEASPRVMVLEFDGKPSKPVDTLVFSRTQIGRIRQGLRKIKWRYSNDFKRIDRNPESAQVPGMNNHCVWWHEADCTWKSFCPD